MCFTSLSICGHRATWLCCECFTQFYVHSKLTWGISSFRAHLDGDQFPRPLLRIHSGVLSLMDRISAMLLSKLKMKEKSWLTLPQKWNQMLTKNNLCVMEETQKASAFLRNRVSTLSFSQRIKQGLGEPGNRQPEAIATRTQTNSFLFYFVLLTSVSHRTEMKGRVLSPGLVWLFDKNSSLGLPLCIF